MPYCIVNCYLKYETNCDAWVHLNNREELLHDALRYYETNCDGLLHDALRYYETNCDGLLHDALGYYETNCDA